MKRNKATTSTVHHRITIPLCVRIYWSKGWKGVARAATPTMFSESCRKSWWGPWLRFSPNFSPDHFTTEEADIQRWGTARPASHSKLGLEPELRETLTPSSGSFLRTTEVSLPGASVSDHSHREQAFHEHLPYTMTVPTVS